VTQIDRVVNPDRSILATVIDKLEISGEFVLIFNKFGPMMALEPGRSLRTLERTDHRSTKAPERIMARKTGSIRDGAPSFLAGFANPLQGLLRDLLDPYRPELHYMRGPGPKWHAKHDSIAADFGAMAGLVRVRVKR
jgi:hypothetical protein